MNMRYSCIHPKFSSGRVQYFHIKKYELFYILISRAVWAPILRRGGVSSASQYQFNKEKAMATRRPPKNWRMLLLSFLAFLPVIKGQGDPVTPSTNFTGKFSILTG